MNFVEIFKFNRETVFAKAVSNISLSQFNQFLFKLSLKYSDRKKMQECVGAA